MPDSEKLITLIPSWKHYFWGYFFGILLSPFLIGIVILWFTIKKNKNLKFEISDNSIKVIKDLDVTELALVDILSTSLKQSSFQSFLNIGGIQLQANVSQIVLEGIEHPSSLLDKIDTAIAYKKEQLKTSKKIQPREPSHDPGTLDKLDYLTGLWQQGLISDEDYDKEKKNFE